MSDDPPEPLIDLQIALDAPRSDLPDGDSLTGWVAAVLARHADELRHELTIRLVADDESQALNRDYRRQDKPTNVLSFPFDAPPGLDLPLLGDLVICHPVVEREAAQQGKPLSHHYAHMVVHGTLHLLGYDHIDDNEAEEMERLERDILDAVGIPDPYAPPSGVLDNEDTRPDA